MGRIEQARVELGSPNVVWYRGHIQGDWSLVPSLLRRRVDQAKEGLLFHKFKQRAMELASPQKSAWETLFDMQHYGVPTRLLDWTEVLGVALYFSSVDVSAMKMGGLSISANPCVWVLNPGRLNESARGSRDLVRCGDSNFSYEVDYWSDVECRVGEVFAIDPPFRNARINAQRGMFTVHGDPRCLSEVYPEAVRKVHAVCDGTEMERFFEYAGLNPHALFPDLEGLATFLRATCGVR